MGLRAAATSLGNRRIAFAAQTQPPFMAKPEIFHEFAIGTATSGATIPLCDPKGSVRR